MDIPWWIWIVLILIILGIAMRRAAQGLKTFYGGLFNFATQNPLGSHVSKFGMLYFLSRIFRR